MSRKRKKSATEICQEAGLPRGVEELHEITGRSRSTLHHWHRENVKFFEIVTHGAVWKRGSSDA